MDNAAFDAHPATEVERVLKAVAGKILDGTNAGVIMDSKGNSIGKFIIYQDTGKKGEKVKV